MPHSLPRPHGALAAALLTVVLWASAFPLIRIGLTHFTPVPLAALRLAVAACFVGLWLGVSARRGERVWLPRAAWAPLLGAAALGIGLYNVLLTIGQQTVSAGATSFIVNTSPVFTALLAMALLGERFNRRAWLGTAVSVLGIAAIAAGQPGGWRLGAGASLVLAAALCQAAFFVLQRRLVLAHGPLRSAAWLVVAGAVWLSPWLWPALQQATTAPPATLLAVLLLGLLPAALGHATWSVAQSHYGAARAANFLYLVPPTTLALSAWLVDEVPHALTWLGGGAAIAGVLIVNRWGRDAAPAAPR